MSPPFARFQYYGNPLTVMKGWAAVLATAFVTYQGVKYALYHSRRQSLLEIRERWHRKLKEFGNLSHDVNRRQRFRMGFRAQNQPPALFDIRFRQKGEVPASRHSERLCPGVDSSQEVLGQGNADSRLIWRPILQQFLG